MPPVSRCTWRSSASWSSEVKPGLSLRKSLPWRSAASPTPARSSGMAALEIRAMLSSFSTSSALRARRACGKRARKSAARSGSAAKQLTSSAPALSSRSVMPWMWLWFTPMTPKRTGVVVTFLLLHGAGTDAGDELALGQEKRQDHGDDRKHDRGHSVVPGERRLIDEGEPNLQCTHVGPGGDDHRPEQRIPALGERDQRQ